MSYPSDIVDSDVLYCSHQYLLQTQLKTLNKHKVLVISEIENPDFNPITETLLTNIRLKILHLRGMQIQYNQIKILCQALKENEHINNLHFDSNDFDNNCIVEIVDLIKTSKTINTIVFQWTRFDYEDMDLIIQLLKSKSNLKSLSLILIRLSYQHSLLSVISYSDLEELEISRVDGISSSEWSNLALYLSNPKCRLKRLNISGNIDIETGVLYEILTSITQNTSLTSLDLSGFKVLSEKKSITFICDILKTNSTLLELKLNQVHPIDQVRFTADICCALRNNFKISQISLESATLKRTYKAEIKKIPKLNKNWAKTPLCVQEHLLIQRYCFQKNIIYVKTSNIKYKREFTLWLLWIFNRQFKIPYDVIWLIMGKHCFWLNGGDKIGAFIWK